LTNITPQNLGEAVIENPVSDFDSRQTGFIKVKRISFSANTSETDTGVDLPSTAVILDVFLKVTTAEAGKTINVGLLSSETGGDADGFVAGASLASTGVVVPAVTVTSGTNEDYLSACTYGAFLADFTAGSDNAGDVGTFNKKLFATDSVTAKSLTYTCSSGTSSAAGYIYIVYVEV